MGEREGRGRGRRLLEGGFITPLSRLRAQHSPSLSTHIPSLTNPSQQCNNNTYRGATREGQLLLGSRIEDLEGCSPTATAFPAGTLFASERHALAYLPGERGWVITDEGEHPGQLFSFVRCADGAHWRGVQVRPRRAAVEIEARGLRR